MKNSTEGSDSSIKYCRGIAWEFDSRGISIWFCSNCCLRINSDVDVLVAVNHRLSEVTRKKLTDRLMLISGKIGNTDSMRRLEVTVINHGDVAPWQYPPKNEFIYGEWLRGEFEKVQIQEPTYDPDLAIVLAQTRKNSVSLFGPDASDILDPVPIPDIRRAIKESLPELIEGIKGDERNVILTLARMWQTVAVVKSPQKMWLQNGLYLGYLKNMRFYST